MSQEQQEKQPETQEQELKETVDATTEKTEEQKEQPDYYDKYIRLSADFDNFRKRTEREKAGFITYGKKSFAEKLLPTYEVLLKQKEILSKNTENSENVEGLKSLQDGMRLIVTELEKAFKAEGIAKMDVVNKPYNTDSQEIIGMIPSTKEQDGLVLQEVQMGFMMDNKVLRPARVIVGQYTEENNENK